MAQNQQGAEEIPEIFRAYWAAVSLLIEDFTCCAFRDVFFGKLEKDGWENDPKIGYAVKKMDATCSGCATFKTFIS